MTGASSSDLVSASRWVRQRVAEAMFVSGDVGADATSLSRSGGCGGLVLAGVVTAVALWGEVALAWVRTLF